jgi:hypothetical protein
MKPIVNPIDILLVIGMQKFVMANSAIPILLSVLPIIVVVAFASVLTTAL